MSKSLISVAIIGSREFDDYLLMKSILDPIKDVIDLIVSGGAKGADYWGEMYADENGINKLIFEADWEKFGKGAGFIRNKDIINNADYIIAFWNGKSNGTKHSLNLAKKSNKKIKIVNF